MTPFSLHLCLLLFIMAEWAGFSCCQKNSGPASPGSQEKKMPKSPAASFLLYPSSPCAADTRPNRSHQGGEEWGLIVFCRHRGQYQRSALLVPHWDSICWVKSVPFFPTSWLECVGLHSGLKKSSIASTLWLASQQNKHPNPEIMPSTWPNETCKHLNKVLDCSGIVVVEDIRPLVPQSDLSSKNIFYYEETWSKARFKEMIFFQQFQFKMFAWM